MPDKPDVLVVRGFYEAFAQADARVCLPTLGHEMLWPPASMARVAAVVRPRGSAAHGRHQSPCQLEVELTRLR